MDGKLFSIFSRLPMYCYPGTIIENRKQLIDDEYGNGSIQFREKKQAITKIKNKYTSGPLVPQILPLSLSIQEKGENGQERRDLKHKVLKKLFG